MTPPFVAIPVKPFSLAKQRLSAALDADTRRRLGVELAARTADVARRGGGRPLILSADDDVTAWAHDAGLEVLFDEGSSLNEAAESATTYAAESPWIVCHADLPLLGAGDIARAIGIVAGSRWVIAPSSDGGTSLIGGNGPFAFGFGVGSFHRHLARLSSRQCEVIVPTGTLLDLDTFADFAAAVSHPHGRWLAEFGPIASI